MKTKLLLSLAMILSGGLLAGCCTASNNLRSRMEQTAVTALPAGEQQVRFAYIGEVQTKQGTFHVVEQGLILSDMMAPRGEPARLLLFSDDARLVAAYEADLGTGARPLWCEGARIYLAGFSSLHFADSISHKIPPDPRLARLFSETNLAPTGNVIDFANGPLNPVMTREKRYGSSGGLEDDPWNKITIPSTTPDWNGQPAIQKP